MYTVLSILIVLTCLLLILVVLIQNPKGGGIASNFAASNQVMGVKKTSEVVEKATWILAVSLIVFTLFTNFFHEGGTAVRNSRIQNQVEEAPVPTGQPGPQQPAPAQQQPQGGEAPAGSGEPAPAN